MALAHDDTQLGTTAVTAKLNWLLHNVYMLYQRLNETVPFHNWDHVWFVFRHTHRFATRNGADQEVALAAALLHDVNHLHEPGSAPAMGSEIRSELLRSVGYEPDFVGQVEQVVLEAHLPRRQSTEPSLEAQALNDADLLFKMLPSTPNMSVNYLGETGISLIELARKILDDQATLADRGDLFYDETANDQYGEWIKHNLGHWKFLLAEFERSEVLRDHLCGSKVPSFEAIAELQKERRRKPNPVNGLANGTELIPRLVHPTITHSVKAESSNRRWTKRRRSRQT